MTTRVGLYYFSGTGNTEIVSELLGAAFEARGARVERRRTMT